MVEVMKSRLFNLKIKPTAFADNEEVEYESRTSLTVTAEVLARAVETNGFIT